MRVLFFGTSEFAVPSLEALARDARFDVIAVVTQPDRAKGRGRHLAVSPVKAAAERLGLPVMQPRRVRSAAFLETARSLAPDVLALASYGQIIPPALLELAPLGPINVHGSLLPAYRGAAPIQRAILAGEAVTGVTTMWMDQTLDTGDMLLRCDEPIRDDDDSDSLTQRLAERGAELLVETLIGLGHGTCPRTPQDHTLATHAPAILPEDAALSWGESAAAIRNRVRAMAPRPGAFTMLRGHVLKVWKCELAEVGGSPGEVAAVTKRGVEVAAGAGGLRLLEVQAEGSRRMPAADWARGARLEPGERFTEVER